MSENRLLARLVGHRRLVILRCLASLPHEQRERLLILRLLTQMPGGIANVSLLRDLSIDAGAPIVRDKVMAAATWLAEHRLVVMTQEDDVIGLHLVERGSEVGEGRRSWPGVAPLTDADWLRQRLAAMSISANSADVRGDIDWLRERGLVTDHITGAMLVLTEAGQDVTTGKLIVEGVQKPSAGAALKLAAIEAAAILKGG